MREMEKNNDRFSLTLIYICYTVVISVRDLGKLLRNSNVTPKRTVKAYTFSVEWLHIQWCKFCNLELTLGVIYLAAQYRLIQPRGVYYDVWYLTLTDNSGDPEADVISQGTSVARVAVTLGQEIIALNESFSSQNLPWYMYRRIEVLTSEFDKKWLDQLFNF